MIPEHWLVTPFKDVLQSLESGSRPKGGVKGISEGVPSIGAEHLNSEGSFNFSKIRFIPFNFARKMNRGIISKNDILIVKDGATTGKVSFVRNDFPFDTACVNEHVFICRLFSSIYPDFCFQFLRSHDGQIQIMSTFHGGAQGGINSEFIDAIGIPLPPLNEQKRIVEKLDAILPKVKSAKAQLERIPTILKKFRKSVLTAACSGRLTEDCRAADDYSESDLPISWEDTPLLNLLKKKPNNGYSGKPVKFETSTRVLTLTATTSGIFNPMFYKYLDEVIDSNANCWLKHNDILMQRGNTVEYVGMPAIYKGTDNTFIFPDLMIRLTPDTTKINPDFLYYFLAWEKTRIQVRNSASGTAGTMPKINQSIFTELSLGVPSIEEQHEIVRRVEKLFSLADSLETKYKKAFSRVEKIEQSILAKAFRGELVEPDPNDEPAEELLKRILEEKAKLEGAKKTKKSTKKAPVKNKVAGNNKLLKKAKK